MTDPRALTARVLALALMGALPILALALFFVLPPEEAPPIWVPLAQLAAGVGLHLLLQAIGYRIPALKPGQSDPGTSFMRYQSAMILRFALAESLMILSLAGAFVLDAGGFWVFVGGAVVSLVLLLVHVWPNRANVERSARSLEADGTRSPLREMFGYAERGGAIQEL